MCSEALRTWAPLFCLPSESCYDQTYLRHAEPLAKGHPHDGIRSDEDLVCLGVKPRWMSSTKIGNNGHKWEISTAPKRQCSGTSVWREAFINTEARVGGEGEGASLPTIQNHFTWGIAISRMGILGLLHRSPLQPYLQQIHSIPSHTKPYMKSETPFKVSYYLASTTRIRRRVANQGRWGTHRVLLFEDFPDAPSSRFV